jgi:hypothetical protein
MNEPKPRGVKPELEERLASYLKMATGKAPKKPILDVGELLVVRNFIRRLRQQAVN